MTSDQYLYLTTQGRKSALPREIEIWFTEREGRFYVIAEYQTSHWLQNLRTHPEVRVRIGQESFPARARVLAPESDVALLQTIRELSVKKHGWGDGTIVELSPNPGGVPLK